MCTSDKLLGNAAVTARVPAVRATDLDVNLVLNKVQGSGASSSVMNLAFSHESPGQNT